MRATSPFKTRLATPKKTGDYDLPKIINQNQKIHRGNIANRTKYNSVIKNNLLILKSAPKAGNQTGSTRFYCRTASKNGVEIKISISLERNEKKAGKKKDERPNYHYYYYCLLLSLITTNYLEVLPSTKVEEKKVTYKTNVGENKIKLGLRRNKRVHYLRCSNHVSLKTEATLGGGFIVHLGKLDHVNSIAIITWPRKYVLPTKTKIANYMKQSIRKRQPYNV